MTNEQIRKVKEAMDCMERGFHYIVSARSSIISEEDEEIVNLLVETFHCADRINKALAEFKKVVEENTGTVKDE